MSRKRLTACSGADDNAGMVCVACGQELPPGARFCPACAEPVQTRPTTSERKLATVVFADLVGSTRLGEQDPERTRLLLERFYDAMTAEIVETGGTVEKFAGDAVMAAFGAPVALEDHAERALHASLSMMRRLADTFGDLLQLRIGVNTGEVVVGSPREGSSFVTGDAVNVAARLEQSAEPGEVIVGARTVASVGGAFEFDPPRHIEARGKTEAVPCQRLVRAVAIARPRGVRGLHRAFVGRDSELNLLQATYRRAYVEGSPHLLTISADPGVGKSRLVREFGAWLDVQDPVPIRRVGRCLAYGSGITYWALGEILKQHLGLLDTDPAEVVRESLGPHEMLGLTLGLDLSGELHPLVARERLQEAWVSFMTDLVAEGPAAILVEDIHWAQEPLLEVLERLVRDVAGPLLLIATTRPELLDTRPTWGRGRNAGTIWLEPLTPSDTEELCRQLLGRNLPPDVRDLVVETAEGNPFYVEELIGSMIDRGQLVRDGETWSAAGLTAEFVAPDSVQSVLAARIDLLPAAEKRALQVASVVGRIFWDEPVRHLLEGEDPDYVLLDERDFIRRRPSSSMPGAREFTIKHALTREVAYATLPKARRAHLHAGFARWLEQVAGDHEELAGLVAHHFVRAVLPEDADIAWDGRADELREHRASAVAWLRRAAPIAAGRYLLDDALAMLHQALDLADEPLERGEIWEQIGLTSAAKYDGAAFWAAMQQALDLLPAERHARLYADLAFFTSLRAGMWISRPDAAMVLGWADRVLALTTDPHLTAKAFIALSQWGDDDEAQRKAAARAVELAEAAGDDILLAQAYMQDADVATAALDLDTLGRRARQLLDLAGGLRDPDVLGSAMAILAEHHLLAGELAAAESRTLAHRDLVHPLTSHHRVHGIGMWVMFNAQVGRWKAVEELTDEAEALVAANAETPCMINALVLVTAAYAAALAGDEREAVRLLQVVTAMGMTGFVQLAVQQARLAFALGDAEPARDMVARYDHRVLSALGSYSTPVYLDLLCDLGETARVEDLATRLAGAGPYLRPFALQALGRVRRDPALTAESAELFDGLGMTWFADRARAVLA